MYSCVYSIFITLWQRNYALRNGWQFCINTRNDARFLEISLNILIWCTKVTYNTVKIQERWCKDVYCCKCITSITWVNYKLFEYKVSTNFSWPLTLLWTQANFSISKATNRNIICLALTTVLVQFLMTWPVRIVQVFHHKCGVWWRHSNDKVK